MKMHHHDLHSLLHGDEKRAQSSSPNDVPNPELDLYRAQISISDDGARECSKLGAKSRWRTSALEKDTEEMAAELGKEKLGWFDGGKRDALEGMKERTAWLDRAKGDILRRLGVMMDAFFDLALQVHPVARSFDVRIDRRDDNSIEAVLFVDQDRECSVLWENSTFELVLEKLKKEVPTAKEVSERRKKEEREEQEPREREERVQHEPGLWQTLKDVV